jgi:hypothetical protein
MIDLTTPFRVDTFAKEGLQRQRRPHCGVETLQI